jgi:hypothetical protein
LFYLPASIAIHLSTPGDGEKRCLLDGHDDPEARSGVEKILV